MLHCAPRAFVALCLLLPALGCSEQPVVRQVTPGNAPVGEWSAGWRQWGGPDGNFRVRAARLATSWPPEGPQDARTLQPVTIPKETLQQYWATVYIPKNTPSGVYNGSLKVEISGVPGITLPLSVEVLPFQLEPSVLVVGLMPFVLHRL